MMELELLREIPGYKAILKSVLKAQIQLLVEQLCEQAGEESIILTASLNDGSLSHLGSKMGKGFFEEREEIKSQFLGYCLKSSHNTDIPQPRTDYQCDKSPKIYSQGPSGPKKQRFFPLPDDDYTGSPGFENQGSQNLFSHSVSSSGPMKRKPLQKKHLPSTSSETVTTPSSDRNDKEHVVTSETSTAPMVVFENISDTLGRTHTDHGDETANVPLGVSEPFGPSGPWSSETGEGEIRGDFNVPGLDHEQSGDSNLDSGVKIEPATGDEELEITGIEMAGGNGGVAGEWAPNVGGELGYQSGLPGDDSLNQSGSQFSTKEFSLTLNRNSHSTADQSDQDLNLSCHICGKISASKYTLRTHVKTHSGLKEFHCHLCSKQFTRKDSLKTHVLGHTGKKDHVCHYCGHAFFKKYNLKTHIHTKHFFKDKISA